MKSEKGITLMSLVLYVVVMVMVLNIMSTIITNFYNNTEAVQASIGDIVEFNKFNSYFLKEIKTTNNKVDTLSNDYILFSTGNSFSLSNNEIYYNNIKICKGVESIQFVLTNDDEDQDGEYSIINVTINFKSFNNTINYKIENIY